MSAIYTSTHLHSISLNSKENKWLPSGHHTHWPFSSSGITGIILWSRKHGGVILYQGASVLEIYAQQADLFSNKDKAN